MADKSAGRVILLSIHPKHVEAILAGQKRVEFRRQRFRHSPSHIVVYATRPIQMIVGYATVEEVVQDSPHQLWRQYRDIGGVKHSFFKKYYDGASVGIAILLTDVRALITPVPLRSVARTLVPPQAYSYLTESEFSIVRQHVGADPLSRRHSSGKSFVAPLLQV